MFGRHKKAQAGGIVGGIVGITVAAILVANVYLPQVFGANQTGWDASTTTLWDQNGLAASIGLMVLTFRVFGIL
jgi:hypothetical protein